MTHHKSGAAVCPAFISGTLSHIIQSPPPSPEYYSFSAPKASDPVPLTVPSLLPFLPSVPPADQTFPPPAPAPKANALSIYPITTVPNRCPSYDSLNKISASTRTFSTLPPAPDQVLSSESGNYRISHKSNSLSVPLFP